MASVPSYLFNAGLKYFGKPVLSRVRINDRRKKIARSGFEYLCRFIPIPRNVHVEYVNINGMKAEWVHAGYIHDERVVLYFHGGGYFFGSARTHRPLTWRLSRACRARVLAINYRQTPEFEFPAPIEDAVMAYRWLLDQGYRAENIIFGGDSAGGNLTLASMLKLKQTGQSLPAAAICISPWADLSSSSASIDYNKNRDPMIPSNALKYLAKTYVGNHDPRDPLLSPVYGDYEGIPPLLLYVGSTEVLLDDVHKVAIRAEAAGVNVTYRVWREMFHVFPLVATFIPEGLLAFRGIKRFIQQEVYPEAAVGDTAPASRTGNVANIADAKIKKNSG